MGTLYGIWFQVEDKPRTWSVKNDTKFLGFVHFHNDQYNFIYISKDHFNGFHHDCFDSLEEIKKYIEKELI